jgi:DNA polymerase-3 subunit beta
MSTVSFQRGQLAAALRILSKSPPWRRDDKVAGVIRINTVGGTATLVSNALDMQIEVTAPCSPEPAAAEFVLPFSTFAALVDRLKEGSEVRLTLAAGGTVVQSGRSRSTLIGLATSALPVRPVLAVAPQPIPAIVLAAGLRAALPAAIDDSKRPFLGGVHVHQAGGGVSFEAQDGARIHAAKQDGTRFASAASIPQRAARIIADLLPEDGNALVCTDARAIQVAAGPVRIVASLLDSRFPPIEAQLAAQTTRTLRARADRLLDDLDLVMTVANQRDRDFRLDLGATCEASAFRPGGDRGAVVLNCQYDGAPIAIGFQFHLVRDALQLFSDSVVEWRMGGPEDATIIGSPDHPGIEAMVSPFRLVAEHQRLAA